MLEFTINQIDHTVNDQTGVAEFARTIHWTVTKVDQSLTASSYGADSIPDTDVMYTQPYGDITEQDTLDALNRILDTDALESQLDAQLEIQQAPQTASGKPWVDNFPSWVTGVAYVPKDVVAYNGESYEVIQGHTSSAEWPPSITPALFKVHVPGDAPPQPWIQPVGSEDAYRLDDQVTHNGNLWTSIHDANTWEPGVSQWTDEGAYP